MLVLEKKNTRENNDRLVCLDLRLSSEVPTFENFSGRDTVNYEDSWGQFKRWIDRPPII